VWLRINYTKERQGGVKHRSTQSGWSYLHACLFLWVEPWAHYSWCNVGGVETWYM